SSSRSSSTPSTRAPFPSRSSLPSGCRTSALPRPTERFSRRCPRRPSSSGADAGRTSPDISDLIWCRAGVNELHPTRETPTRPSTGRRYDPWRTARERQARRRHARGSRRGRRLGRAHDAEELPVLRPEVDLSGGVFAEGRHLWDVGRQHLAVSEEPAEAIVAVEIDTRERRVRGAPVNVAADDGSRAVAAAGVSVLVERRLEDRRVAGRNARGTSRAPARAAERSLHDLPAVVLAPRARPRLEIDLLAGALADVGDVEVARRPVEGEAPGVAQPLRPDLV